VTGQFNAHMASCLLLQADEAVWAGDKAAEPTQRPHHVAHPADRGQRRGSNPAQNYVRLIMTSNEAWVVPAVDARCAGNHGYFREMAEVLEGGGYEALLHDLLTFDLAVEPQQVVHR
jgi:hypothetical protein